MKNIPFREVKLSGGYLYEKQVLNSRVTLDAVYDRFFETGRISAFDFNYDPIRDGENKKPHVFWDSDVAKWIEGAAYEIRHRPSQKLTDRIEALVEKIKAHQGEDGYFNIYYTVIEPDGRWKERSRHELYCAGHLIEAAVAYDETSGKHDFLACMEKYCDYIERVFVIEKSSAFKTPGHEEIELALLRLYRYTGKEKYLGLAKHFLELRGRVEGELHDYDQSHLPIREQSEAVGHSVRAMYLYTAMAMLAKEMGDGELKDACRRLWEDTVYRKMYITGGIGSTRIGEAFTVPYDLPNDLAYTETCAAIGLVLFSAAMLELENDARYADVIERAIYNGLLSGLSLSGDAFFYENPLEINLRDRFESAHGKRIFPLTRRQKCFGCSCCPPNVARFLASIGDRLYATEDGTLYVNQFAASTLRTDGITCRTETDYPRNGEIRLEVAGAKRVAIRIPSWCKSFTCDRAYTLEGGYAIVEGDGEIKLEFDMTPTVVYADCRVRSAAGRAAVMRGPVVYCAEGVDNGADLHSYRLSLPLSARVLDGGELGLPMIEVDCKRRLPFAEGELYSARAPRDEAASVKLIPYSCFANREESDMAVWLLCE